MEYQELSDILIRESGRYDLQNADGSDNGLNRFINSGQRMLDRKGNILQTEARTYPSVEQGAYYLTIPECRVVESVWVLNQPLGLAATRIPMIEVPWDDLQMQYPMLASQMVQSTPCQYARGSFRAAPSNLISVAQNMNSFAGFNDTFADQNFDTDGIFFAPAADAQYGFQVVGKFYTQAFTNDIMSTLWSALYPELLIAAARFWMEVANRNTEGRKDWEAIIQDQLTDLDKDRVEQYTNGGLVMGDPDETTVQYARTINYR